MRTTCEEINVFVNLEMVQSSIERGFGDAKTKYGIGFTRYCGKQRLLDDVYLLFAAMNMKKMINYLSKAKKGTIKSLIFNFQLANNVNFF